MKQIKKGSTEKFLAKVILMIQEHSAMRRTRRKENFMRRQLGGKPIRRVMIMRRMKQKIPKIIIINKNHKTMPSMDSGKKHPEKI
jgi:hypothetical protein